MRKPSIQTKTGNYLLRSTRRDAFIDLMALIHAGRVASDRFAASLVKADGSWVGNPTWSIKMLESRGLVEKDPQVRQGRLWYRLTDEGHQALDGALMALGRRVDTVALLAKVDSFKLA